MQKLDRLGWAAALSLKSYGVRIGIRVNEAQGMERVFDHLPHDWEMSSSEIVNRLYSIVIGRANNGRSVKRFNLLYRDHLQLTRSLNANDVFTTLESDLRLFVAEVAPHRLFVHAGVVGWQGKAIVIPGRSFSGKSTLVAELVKAGATYYSDEYAVVDARGRVHPFHKPLEIRPQGEVRQIKLAVSDLGGQAGTKALPVGLVLITSFKDRAKWRPRRLSAGAGVLELLANTVSARRKPEKALATLQQVAAAAQIFKGVRGAATDLVPLILEREWTQTSF